MDLETDRLILRKFSCDDWPDLYEYLSNETVVKYEPYDVFTEETSKQEAIRRSQDNAFGPYVLKKNNKLIGNLYFQQQEPKDFLTWEIGYVFNPAYYSNGYATEACKRIFKFAFEQLGAHRIIGKCNPENAASWRLLERLSMRREGHYKKPAFFCKTADGKPIWHDAYQYSIWMKIFLLKKSAEEDFNMLEVKTLSESFADAAVSLAVDNYLLEQEKNDALYNIDYRKEIIMLLDDLFREHSGVALFDNNELAGYLGFDAVWDTHIPNIKGCSSPVHGYAIRRSADRAKIASMLFQHASEKMAENNVEFFAIKLYAHDKDVISSFVLNQFGILCTDAIKYNDARICEQSVSECSFKELTKNDIVANKEQLLSLWHKLAGHLRQSPTYYPGTEFTDDMYLDFIGDNETRLFAAEHNDKIIGILDASKGGNSFINSDEKTMNIGDLFVSENYRGNKTAQELLQFACGKLKGEGYARVWVEHGTTNPNALRFWGKYFKPFTYTLTRRIDSSLHTK